MYRLFLNKFLPTAASLLFAFLIFQVTGHAAENIPFAVTQALESARLSQDLNLEVDSFPIEASLGGTTVLELSLENLSSSERKEIYIDGIKKGSTKLTIEVSEAGKESLPWEIPVMVGAY